MIMLLLIGIGMRISTRGNKTLPLTLLKMVSNAFNPNHLISLDG